MKRKLSLALVTFILAGTVFSVKANAEVPYETYCYNYYSDTIPQPHVYLYDETFSFSDFDTPLKNPLHMFIKDGFFYIADTDNSRIVKTNEAGELLLEIDSAKNGSD